MTLLHVTADLSAKALTRAGITHSVHLQRGLRLALRYRRQHYTLSIGREGVFPSVAERAVLRRAFSIPKVRKWRTARRMGWHMWYIFWNPDNKHPLPDPPLQLKLPALPLREITNPIILRSQQPHPTAHVGPDDAGDAAPGDPT